DCSSDLGQSHLMRLTPSEDRLEPADELESSTSVLFGHGIGCGARQAERRQQCRKPADQAGEYQETSAPHGAQSYQTLERVGALLTNPFDPVQRSRRCRLAASATNGRNCTAPED